MSNSFCDKAHPSTIYAHVYTRHVIHTVVSYTDTLFKRSQMKIMKLEFPIFPDETIFTFKTSLLLLNFCLYIYCIAGNHDEYSRTSKRDWALSTTWSHLWFPKEHLSYRDSASSLPFFLLISILWCNPFYPTPTLYTE